MGEYAFVIGSGQELNVGLFESRALATIADKLRKGQAFWTAARPLGAKTYRVDRHPLVGGVIKDPDLGYYGDAHTQVAWARMELFAAQANPDTTIQNWAQARLRDLESATLTPWSKGVESTGSFLSRLRVAPLIVFHRINGHNFTQGPVTLNGGYAYVSWRHGAPVAACVIRRGVDEPGFTILVRFSARQSDVNILADYLRAQGLSDAANYAKAHSHEAPVFA